MDPNGPSRWRWRPSSTGGYRLTKHGNRWRFQARVDGRKVRPSFGAIEEAKQAIDALRATKDQSSTVGWIQDLDTGHVTVAELCDAWLKWKSGAETDEPIRPRTRRDYRRVLDRLILPILGSHDAATITTADLKRDFFRICPSRTGARFARTILQQAFRWGIEQRLVWRRDNPCVDVRLVRRDAADGRNRKTSSIKAVTDEEIPTPGEIQKMLVWCLETGRTTWWLWVYCAATLACVLLKYAVSNVRTSTSRERSSWFSEPFRTAQIQVIGI